MGLDIYFYTIKDKDKYRKYQAAARKYDAISDEMHKKYKEPYEAACKKWNEWYEAETEKEAAASNNNQAYNINFDEAPRAELTDFMTNVESLEYNNAVLAYHDLQKDLRIDYNDNIEELYMRKKNWMSKFVETRHPELLTHETEDYGKVLENGQALLSRADIEELVRRMRKVTENFREYHDICPDDWGENGWRSEGEMKWIEEWKPTDEMANTAEQLLPGMSRFFYGSTEYDYYYFEGIKYYVDKFQAWLDEHEYSDCLLYEESW